MEKSGWEKFPEPQHGSDTIIANLNTRLDRALKDVAALRKELEILQLQKKESEAVLIRVIETVTSVAARGY